MTEHEADAVSKTEGMQREVLADASRGELMPRNTAPLATIDPLDATPVSLLSQALAQGLDTETLEKFMDLQERYEANEARKAYAADMAKCQKAMQPIVAAAENDHTKSYYAKLGVINSQIAPIYGKHGFSISFGMGIADKDGEIRTTAKVLHKMGHFEEYHMDLPPDDVGSAGNVNKTKIHARASSNTYGRRYIVMGIFNLSILSEDDDGNAAGGTGSEVIDPEQLVELQSMMDQAGIKAAVLAREFGIDSLDQLPAKKFEKVKQRIEQISRARSQQ